jgi:hypothetical protein
MEQADQLTVQGAENGRSDRSSSHRLVPTANHGPHREAHALVRVDEVREVLARRRDRDPFVVPQLVQPALDAEVGFPVLAVGCVM